MGAVATASMLSCRSTFNASSSAGKKSLAGGLHFRRVTVAETVKTWSMLALFRVAFNNEKDMARVETGWPELEPMVDDAYLC